MMDIDTEDKLIRKIGGKFRLTVRSDPLISDDLDVNESRILQSGREEMNSLFSPRGVRDVNRSKIVLTEFATLSWYLHPKAGFASGMMPVLSGPHGGRTLKKCYPS